MSRCVLHVLARSPDRVLVVEETAEQVATECHVDAITNRRELAAQIKRTLKNKHS